MRRAPVLLVLAAALIAGAAADRVDRPADPSVGSRVDAGAPLAPPASAESSTWYCAGATAKAGGAADGSVIIANAGARAVSGSLIVVPNEGERKRVDLDVPARTRRTIRHGDVVTADYAAAVVELDGGDVVVEHSVRGPLGMSVAPCASSASDRWYLAEGSTARDDSMLLALQNPFAEDAIADLSFFTDQGRAVPADFQGILVPGRGLTVVNVADHVRRRNDIATSVVARSGRLVVDRIQLRNTLGHRGLSLSLAAPSPAETWYFPEGFLVEGVAEHYHLYNPGRREAQLDLEVTVDEGAVEPFQLNVASGERVSLLLNEEGRVPKGVPHAVTVRSLNGVGVVAERSLDALPPATRTGTTESLGGRLTARRWVLAGGGSTESLDEWVVVQNVGTSEATVDIFALAEGRLLPVDGLQDASVPAGRRQVFRLGDHIKREELALLIDSSVPVVIERALYRVGGPGISTAIGVPLRDS